MLISVYGMGEAKVMRGEEKYRLVVTVKEIRGNCPV
jgi:hypothetical protein